MMSKGQHILKTAASQTLTRLKAVPTNSPINMYPQPGWGEGDKQKTPRSARSLSVICRDKGQGILKSKMPNLSSPQHLLLGESRVKPMHVTCLANQVEICRFGQHLPNVYGYLRRGRELLLVSFLVLCLKTIYS